MTCIATTLSRPSACRAAVVVSGIKQTQTFKSTLAGLAELAGWLADAGVTLVGMEATGVYWKTVFQALEERFECWLLNAHHLRNVALV